MTNKDQQSLSIFKYDVYFHCLNSFKYYVLSEANKAVFCALRMWYSIKGIIFIDKIIERYKKKMNGMEKKMNGIET